MRQIFTSPRLETVEGVARLLNEHGIETWISEARSYQGNRRREFSFRDSERAAQGQRDPALWVVHSDDLAKARTLLREAGLLDSTRGDSYLPQGNSITEPANPNRLASKLRLFLLAAVAILTILTISRSCTSTRTAPPAPEQEPESHIIVIDTSSG